MGKGKCVWDSRLTVSLHPNFHCLIMSKHATSNQLETLRTYHKTQTIANHFIDELKEYMNWKTTWIEITKTHLNWKKYWNERLLWNAITKTKLLGQSTPSRRRHNIVVGEKVTLDVWEVDGWLRDPTKLNEVFNVMTKMNVLISRMTMVLMLLAILTCIVIWNRGVWSIPFEI